MPNEGRPQASSQALDDEDFMKNRTHTLAAGQALSERMRGRAEIYRVINRTKSRNDYDFEARTIDALIALAASRGSDYVAATSSGRDHRMRAAGGGAN